MRLQSFSLRECSAVRGDDRGGVMAEHSRGTSNKCLALFVANVIERASFQMEHLGSLTFRSIKLIIVVLFCF